VQNFAARRRNLSFAEPLEAQRSVRSARVDREGLARMLNLRTRVAAAWEALGTG
jgi:hypothetical protein